MRTSSTTGCGRSRARSPSPRPAPTGGSPAPDPGAGYIIGVPFTDPDPPPGQRPGERPRCDGRVDARAVAGAAGGHRVVRGDRDRGPCRRRRAARQEYELLDRQRAFGTRVTHELKTPLAGIKVMAENLESGAFRDEDHRRRWPAGSSPRRISSRSGSTRCLSVAKRAEHPVARAVRSRGDPAHGDRRVGTADAGRGRGPQGRARRHRPDPSATATRSRTPWRACSTTR